MSLYFGSLSFASLSRGQQTKKYKILMISRNTLLSILDSRALLACQGGSEPKIENHDKFVKTVIVHELRNSVLRQS